MTLIKHKNFIQTGVYKIFDLHGNTGKLSSTIKHYKTCIYKSKDSMHYFEIQVIKAQGSCRVGMASLKAELFAPLGYDIYSFAYQSKNGYGIHNSIRKTFGERLKLNDILGILLTTRNFNVELHFFINGKKVPQHYTIPSELSKDRLYPAFSLYDGCEIMFNFGPYFVYEIISKINYAF